VKNILKRVIRDEKGQAMFLTVILLLVGGLIVSSLLAYMGNGLLNGRVYERRTAELYAADAGVEDAVWKIQNATEVKPPVACGDPTSWNYNITDVNGKRVVVTITYMNNTTNTATYLIESTAIADDGGGTAAIDSSTTVEAYVTGVGGNYSGLLDNIITSLACYTAKGTLSYPPENEPYCNYPPEWWPPASVLDNFYWVQVKGKTNYSSPIDLAGNNMTLETGYVNGPLTIANSNKNKIPTLTLNGTLYITGDTTIAYSSGGGGLNNGEMILDLNGNTIFVNSTTAKYALYVGDNCDIKGPGVLIAVGGIYFKPKSQVTTDPVFILSILGETQMQPMGDFYGAVAGDITVTLQPNTSLTYPIGGFGSYNLNFPTGTQQLVYSIASWEVSQQ